MTEQLSPNFHVNCNNDLPAGLVAAFMRSPRVVQATKGKTIFSAGDEAGYVYWIKTGYIQISMLAENGRKTILRDLGPGEVFGELAIVDGLPRSADAVALVPSLLTSLSGHEFKTLIGEVPQAGLWMANQMASLVRDLSERAFALSTLPVGTRIHGELVRIAKSVGRTVNNDDTIYIQLMPTHAEIAARIGTHREAVSRELAQLSQEGLVKQSRRSLTIASLAKLEHRQRNWNL
jgi:CRP/FNR family transcriptional regulator, cyclic AMP receptor protein